MRFCIVTVGWHCAHFVEQTLRSVEEQTDQDWEVWIVDDASPDGTADVVHDWCKTRWKHHGDLRWFYTLNTEQRFAVYNQVHAIKNLDPADDDVLVWLDLDGDRFAHPDVLAHLREVYADPDVLLTYGNYRPDPDKGTCTFPTEYPPDVVASNSYRADTLRHGYRVNHLRTMRSVVFRNIPESEFKWPDGRWYKQGNDYSMMLAGLELAGERHRCLDEVLLIYNEGNPLKVSNTVADEYTACVMDFLKRPPLSRLEVAHAEVDG